MKNQKKSMSLNDSITVIGVTEGKIPPNATDIEEALIGTLLVFSEAIEKIIHLLNAEMFYKTTLGTVYDTIISIHNRHEPIDILTVTNELRVNGKIEEVGGASYLTKLTMPIMLDSHVEHHAAIIFDKFIQREIIRFSANAMELSYSGEHDIDGLFAIIERQISTIGEMVAGKKKSRDLHEILNDCVVTMYQRIENYKKGMSNGVCTGFCDLDKLTNGWQNSDLIILAARPSMGKTAVATKMIRSAAESGIPVVVFSLEMQDVQIANRMILATSGVNSDRYGSGAIDIDEVQLVEKGIGKLYDLPVSIDHNGGINTSYIRAQSKILKKSNKCGLIVIDYMQLIKESVNSQRNREQAISAISAELKYLAKELNVPVIALSQLNRDCEKRGDKKPILADLRDSGSIEQDADVVIFVHRPSKYGQMVADEYGNTIVNYGELIVAKQRNGKTGDVKFTHNGNMTEFYDYDNCGYKNFYETEVF